MPGLVHLPKGSVPQLPHNLPGLLGVLVAANVLEAFALLDAALPDVEGLFYTA